MNHVSLGEVSEFIRGVTFKPEQLVDNKSAGSLVCMRTKNVQSDLDVSDLISVPSDVVKNKKKILTEGDLLVSTANSFKLVGKTCWVPKLDYPATAGGFISILRADDTLVDRRYLFHWMISNRIQHKLRYCGRQTTNISNMSFEQAQAIKIPLPPLKEQKRIAAILDKADAICRKRQQAIELADQFLRSVFLDMFGDPVTNPKGWKKGALKDFTVDGDRINYGVVQPGGDFQDGVPLVRAGDLGNMEVSLSELKLIDPNIEKAYSRSRLVGDEVLITCVGSIGEIALASPELKGANIARAVARVRFGDKVDSVFGAYQLATESIKNYFDRETRTVAQPTLNIKQITETMIMVPPKQAQNEFLAIAKRIESLKERVSQSSNLSTSVFNSLSLHAFKGELAASKAA